MTINHTILELQLTLMLLCLASQQWVGFNPQCHFSLFKNGNHTEKRTSHQSLKCLCTCRKTPMLILSSEFPEHKVGPVRASYKPLRPGKGFKQLKIKV